MARSIAAQIEYMEGKQRRRAGKRGTTRRLRLQRPVRNEFDVGSTDMSSKKDKN